MVLVFAWRKLQTHLKGLLKEQLHWLILAPGVENQWALWPPQQELPLPGRTMQRIHQRPLLRPQVGQQCLLWVNLNPSLRRVPTALQKPYSICFHLFWAGTQLKSFVSGTSSWPKVFCMQFSTLPSDSAQILWEFLNHSEGFKNVALYLWGSLHSQSSWVNALVGGRKFY